MSDPVVPVPSVVPIPPAERAQFWREAITAFATSGLSVREFCRQRGLHERRFHTWRKNLGLSPVARPSPTTPAATTPVPGFVPVQLVNDTTASLGGRVVSGVSQSGSGRHTPPSPTTSGSAPRSDATTGRPFSIASAATRPNDSHHTDGITTTRLRRSNRRGSAVFGMWCSDPIPPRVKSVADDPAVGESIEPVVPVRRPFLQWSRPRPTGRMKPGTYTVNLHPWRVTPEEAVALQTQLAARVDTSTPLGPVRMVAGCDIAYHPTEPLAFAAVVIWDVVRAQEVTRSVVTREMTFPYVPGLLSFRECPPLLAAFERLRFEPDAVMLDGQGVAHPRRFGLACHLGLWLDLPTVGCAKTWLTGDHAEVGPKAGESTPLTIGGETVGAVVRTADQVRPCFVSPGHRCDVASAVELVRRVLSGYRHPTPTRLAHMAANAARTEHLGESECT